MPPATSSSVLRRLRDEGDNPTIRTASPDDPRSVWRDAFRTVRAETERRAALLSPEDQVVQSMPDASPTKWHRAHTTWFLEQFLLAPRLAGYRVFTNASLISSTPTMSRPAHAMRARDEGCSRGRIAKTSPPSGLMSTKRSSGCSRS